MTDSINQTDSGNAPSEYRGGQVVITTERLQQVRGALNRLLNLAKHPLTELSDVSPADDILNDADIAMSILNQELR